MEVFVDVERLKKHSIPEIIIEWIMAEFFLFYYDA